MKKIFAFLAAIMMIMGFLVPATPAYADNDVDGATILNDCWEKAKDDTDGDGIKCLLKTVVDIMTAGIGILGVIGIIVVGLQYITSGGNEEQARKAKRRLFEIVIGLIAYVIIYAALNWLIPNFSF